MKKILTESFIVEADWFWLDVPSEVCCICTGGGGLLGGTGASSSDIWCEGRWIAVGVDNCGGTVDPTNPVSMAWLFERCDGRAGGRPEAGFSKTKADIDCNCIVGEFFRRGGMTGGWSSWILSVPLWWSLFALTIEVMYVGGGTGGLTCLPSLCPLDEDGT